MKRKLKKFKIIYESLWDKASPEQKKEYQERLDQVYDMLFNKVLEIEKGKNIIK